MSETRLVKIFVAMAQMLLRQQTHACLILLTNQTVEGLEIQMTKFTVAIHSSKIGQSGGLLLLFSHPGVSKIVKMKKVSSA